LELSSSLIERNFNIWKGGALNAGRSWRRLPQSDARNAAVLRFIDMSSPELARMARAAGGLAISKFDVTVVNAVTIASFCT
jgi:hypothetical protein